MLRAPVDVAAPGLAKVTAAVAAAHYAADETKYPAVSSPRS